MSDVQLLKINEDVRSFVEVANQGQRGLRVVPLGVAFEVARRSLSATEGETFSVRRFRALSDVSAFVTLSQKNKVTTLSALNTDLLPVAHPASTQRHRMSQFNVLRAQARWFADDVRVADSNVSSLLATLFTESSDTSEYAYAASRLSAMTAGGITLSALVAVALGFNDGANGGYWRQQIRDRNGRWARMFGLGSFKIRKSDGKVYNQYGRIVSTDVRNNKARLLTPDGRIVEVSTDALSREVKALLPSAETPDGVSAKPVRSSSEDVVINEQDLAVFPSPGGFNPADDSSALPGGMDSANVEEIWEEADGNFQVVRGNFRDGEGSEFVVSRLEQGRVVPIGAGKDWADVQQIIDVDEPNFRDGKDAVANLPEGLDLSPSGDAPAEDEQVAELPEGPYKVDRGPYEPRGAGDDVESDGFTDDPADLALQFGPEQIGDALKEAVDDGTGVARLDFGDDGGTEDVPAEALYNALKVQGVDADQFLDDVEAGKDVKATLPRGADIPELDAPRGGRYENAKAIREILGDKLPALLQGLSDRELDAVVVSEFDFRSLVDANQDKDVPEGFYALDDSNYNPIGPIPGAPDEMTPFQLAVAFSPEQLENQLREALTPGAERSGYGKFDMPDSDGESESFDVPAEAITDALKLHAIDTNELLDEIYGGGTPTDEEINAMIDSEGVAETEGGLSQEQKDELIAATKEGGYTVDFVSGEVPTDGYMVAAAADVPDGDGGLRKREEVISREDFDAEPIKYLDEFTSRNIDKLKEDGYYIGTWTSTVADEETGEEREYVFFDVSERIEDKEEALRAARDRNEIAIFGIEESEEFFTDPEREAQKNAGQEAPEGDDESSEQLPGDDGAGTPGVAEGDQPSDSGEPEQEEVVERPFGEEVQELDVSGDLEAQINDAIDNQRELAFAYQGSQDDVVDRLVRPVRLEENKRTGNVSLLAKDDEGNFKKFTLSKMENSSDAEASRDEVVGEDTRGDEIEVDDAELPNSDAYDDARSAVIDEVFDKKGDNTTNDVEDLGERNDINDNATTDIVEAVDDEDEAPLSEDEFAKAVADVIRNAIGADDAEVPSLEELLERVGDKDNFDPDLIWQDVIDEFDGKILPNGHIVVSSVMHGDRRYDVVVRRDERNNFHVYHRVVYPNGKTKVHEMGKLGWQSTKALFDKVQKQIANSVQRPGTTINKNLKPESDRTLRAAIILPQADDAFVTANGSTVSKGDTVAVVRENHSKFGQRAKILRAERRFTVDGYRYTDYLRVKYEDGETNWIRSQSVDPAEGAERGTTPTPEAQAPAPSRDLEQASADLNQKQSEASLDDLFGTAATPDVDGYEIAATTLAGAVELLPVPKIRYGVDTDVPDDDIQPLAREISDLAESLELGGEELRRRLDAGAQESRFVPELLNKLNMNAQYLSMLGVQLRSVARDSSSERAGFYSDLADRIVLFADNWFEDVRTANSDYMDESARRLSERLPEGSIPSSEDITIADVEFVLSQVLKKLPAPDETAEAYANEGMWNGVMDPYLHGAAADLEKALDAIVSGDADLSSLSLAPLGKAQGSLANNPDSAATAEDLKELYNSILGTRSQEQPVAISLPGGESVDPLEIQEARIASGENSISLTPGTQNILLEPTAGGSISLTGFEDEINEFFGNGGGSLAQLSPRARVALQKKVSEKLRIDPLNLSDDESLEMINLLVALDTEEQAYHADRGGVGEEANVLREMSVTSLFKRGMFAFQDGDEIRDDNGDLTGWVVENAGGGGVNETVQLRNKDTDQLLWIKMEMGPSHARAEYVASQISRALGVPGAPIIEFFDEKATGPGKSLLLITQAGEGVGVEGIDQYSDVYNEYSGSVDALGQVALLDVIRMGVLDVAIYNEDRHGGNFLVGNIGQYGVEGEEYSRRLIPIDHGLAANLIGTWALSLKQDMESYVSQDGSSGGRLIRNLITMMGADNFNILSTRVAGDLLASLRNLRGDARVTLRDSDIEFAFDTAINDLEDYLSLDYDVFEQIEARGPEG